MKPFVAPFVAFVSLSYPAFANPNCANVAEALAGLASTYGEAVRVTALMAGGNMLIITAAPGGSWTALEVRPGGQACIVSAGDGFGLYDAPIPGVDG